MTEFRSLWGVYLTRITINGCTKTLRFAELRDGDSYYATSSNDEVKALKSHPSYGTDFYLFKEDPAMVEKPIVKVIHEKAKVKEEVSKNAQHVIDETKTVDPITSQIEKVEAVVNINQAREYLIKKGVIIQKLRTPKSILKYATEEGVEFPNLKTE